MACRALDLSRSGKTGAFGEIIDARFQMPKVMKQLAFVQVFSWFGLFAMWIYTTPAVTAFHFGTSDPTSKLYNQGADWVGLLFGLYNGLAALAALIIPVIARHTNRRFAHGLRLSLGGAGLAAFALIKDPNRLWVPMIGMAWASILSVPYSIWSSTLPARKMDLYGHI